MFCWHSYTKKVKKKLWQKSELLGQHCYGYSSWKMCIKCGKIVKKIKEFECLDEVYLHTNNKKSLD